MIPRMHMIPIRPAAISGVRRNGLVMSETHPHGLSVTINYISPRTLNLNRVG